MRLVQFDRFQMCIQVQGKLEVLSSKYSPITILFGKVEVQQPTSNFSTIGRFSHEYSGLVKRTILTCSKRLVELIWGYLHLCQLSLGIIFYLTCKGEEYGNVVLCFSFFISLGRFRIPCGHGIRKALELTTQKCEV